ncbi:ribosomal protein S7 domain-containing protein [Entophlyctis helioformis]|nr:ribosomal protein S7 domain-containing protein [Entophlyctis helioformis]
MAAKGPFMAAAAAAASAPAPAPITAVPAFDAALLTPEEQLLQQQQQKAQQQQQQQHEAEPAIVAPTDPALNLERESPILELFVKTIMRSGKMSLARSILSDALLHIQLETRENPRAVLDAAVEKVAPQVKVVTVKRGGRNVQMPVPLEDRKRHRAGILWIRDAALNGKNPSKSAGERLGREILAVMNNTSSALTKREQVHKQALANRSNVIMTDRKMRK